MLITKGNLTQAEYDEIESLMNQGLEAYNKKYAQKYINSLEALKSNFHAQVFNILSELCANVETASGRVSDKGSKEEICRRDLYKLKNLIEK